MEQARGEGKWTTFAARLAERKKCALQLAAMQEKALPRAEGGKSLPSGGFASGSVLSYGCAAGCLDGVGAAGI
jgi:hypothetical protein